VTSLPRTVTTAVRPSPGANAVPPITPNNPRPVVPGAGRVGRNTVETMLFRGTSTPVAFALVVIQSRFLDPEGRGRFVLVVLTVSILARLFGQLGVAGCLFLTGMGLGSVSSARLPYPVPQPGT